jgi:hypothetical protein
MLERDEILYFVVPQQSNVFPNSNVSGEYVSPTGHPELELWVEVVTPIQPRAARAAEA